MPSRTPSNLRLRRFFSAVASGYAQLAANSLYVLASVPLALHFLQKREFGLWALAAQLTGYLQLIDLGMTSSVSRHLIDYKDDESTGEYGGLIKTGALVLSVQGVLVLLAGTAIVFFGAHLLHIDPDLERSFQIVMLIQCAIVAIDFPARLFGHILAAHQRAYISNYAQVVFFIVSYLVLWFCLAHGVGIFSLVWVNTIGWLILVFSHLIACFSLGLLPAKNHWGRATWSKFRELFGFGKDVFWIALGTQMISASQAIVVTRSLGLNATAVWSVCTRGYMLANQIVWRPFDLSHPMFSEMVVRGERDRLHYRFKGLVVLTVSLSVIGAVAFALCNRPFVAIWTHGQIAWSMGNDVLLAIWMVISAVVHCLCGLPFITKQIGFLRYIYFIEGAVFLGIGSIAAHNYGFPGLLVTSILSTITFSFSYGMWRTIRQFDLPSAGTLLRWFVTPANLIVLLTICGAAAYWLGRTLSPQLQLVLFLGLITLVATLVLLRQRLGSELVAEIRGTIGTY